MSLLQGGAWEAGLRLLAECSRRGPAPNATTLSLIVSACSAAKRPLHGVALFRAAIAGGIQADTRSINGAIYACTRGRDWRTALLLLAMLRTSGTAPEGNGPTNHSWSAAIASCASARRWAHALRLLESITRETDAPPDVVSYSAAISAMEKGRKWRHALRLLSEVHGKLNLSASIATNSLPAVLRRHPYRRRLFPHI